ncbi:MAG: MurR/RpiR family transcriptional regulator [Clostridia bacterium]|nr:MurR/RpiR family transcriptional regulator [Clostridia bacterium]
MKPLLDSLRENYNSFSKGKKKIADYLLVDYDKAAFMTAAHLGEEVGISESTVVRFASELGFSGYPEFQRYLQQLVVNRLTTVQRAGMAAGMKRGEVLKRVLSNDAAVIMETIDLVSAEAFDAAVEAILKARKIYVLGLRSAMPLAQFLAYYLDFVCDDVMFINGAVQNLKERVMRLDERDVLIGISFPRYDAKTTDALCYARSRGACVIALTDRQDSPPAQNADIALLAKADMISYADSLAAPFSIINALLVAVGLSRNEEAAKRLQQLEDVWGMEGIYL